MWRKEPCRRLEDYVDEAFCVDESDNLEVTDDPEPVDYEELYSGGAVRKQVQRLARARASGRVTAVVQLRAFAMCRRSPLSPARVLTRDCLRVIFSWLVRFERLVVASGLLLDDGDVQPLDDDGQGDLSVWELLVAGDWCWRRLPDLPMSVRRGAMASWGGQLYLVGGQTEGGSKKHKLVGAPSLMFDGTAWKQINLLGDGKKARLGCAAIVHCDLLFVLGGSRKFSWQNDGKGNGRPDVCINLKTDSVVFMPQRPQYDVFCRTKAVMVGRILVCWSVAQNCRNRSNDGRMWVKPSDPAACCNQLMFLDAEATDRRWWPLPCLSAMHCAESVAFWAQGSYLHLEHGRSSEVGCPCCGPMQISNFNHYYLDLSRLPEEPFWRFWVDKEVAAERWENVSPPAGEHVIPTRLGVLRFGAAEVGSPLATDITLDRDEDEECEVVARFGQPGGPVARLEFACVLTQ